MQANSKSWQSAGIAIGLSFLSALPSSSAGQKSYSGTAQSDQQLVQLVATKQYEKALALQEAVLKIHPSDLAGLKRLFQIQFCLGNYFAALQAGQRVLNLTPADVRYLYNVALCHQLIGQTSLAVEEYRSVLGSFPDHLEAKIGLCQCLLKEKRTKEAVIMLEELAAKKPLNADVWFNLAAAYKSYGDGLGWDAAARKAIQLDPLKPQYYPMLIQGQLAHFDFSEAEKTANAFRDRFPRSGEPYAVLFMDFYLTDNRPDKAFLLFDKMSKETGISEDIYILLGKAFRKKYLQTAQCPEYLLRKNAPDWLELSELSLRKCVYARPDNMHYALELATTLVAENKRTQAWPLVKGVIVRLPEDPVAQELWREVAGNNRDIAGRLKAALRGKAQ